MRDGACLAIDSSGLIAILCDEPERAEFNTKLAEYPRRIISAANLLETRIVLFRRGGDAQIALLGELLLRARIEAVAVNLDMVDLAFDAFRRFGKGVGRPGVLNFGDCFAYALAKVENAPLLFKGNDFAHTDVVPALPLPSRDEN